MHLYLYRSMRLAINDCVPFPGHPTTFISCAIIVVFTFIYLLVPLVYEMARGVYQFLAGVRS